MQLPTVTPEEIQRAIGFSREIPTTTVGSMETLLGMNGKGLKRSRKVAIFMIWTLTKYHIGLIKTLNAMQS